MGQRMNERNLEGFTLIETILALGIGGAILAMVFMVLPGVFANARDGQRRDDVLLTVSKLKNFQANNNRGALPSGAVTSSGLYISGDSIVFGSTTGVAWMDFYRSFFDENYTDPAGSRYNWKIISCGTSSAGTACPNANSIYNTTFDGNNFTMYFVVSATCNGDTAVATPNNRMVSVLYRLEKSEVYCANT